MAVFGLCRIILLISSSRPLIFAFLVKKLLIPKILPMKNQNKWPDHPPEEALNQTPKGFNRPAALKMPAVIRTVSPSKKVPPKTANKPYFLSIVWRVASTNGLFIITIRFQDTKSHFHRDKNLGNYKSFATKLQIY